MVGSTLGRYRILETIGAGGMGVVYRAYDPSLERDVALKLLKSGPEGVEPGDSRVVREALALSRLNHPHICTIYEIGEAGGQTFIAMEYVKGRPLSAVISRGGLPDETTMRYGAQIADALAHAHRQGVVHRDLKSANVVITPDGDVKVLDFGLAKRGDASHDAAAVTQPTITQPTITQPGTVLGTPAYMAPESWAGAPADARADVWALGVILYEMAAGEPPFRAPSVHELAAAIIRDPAAPLPASHSPALQAIVQRCLAKEPGQRYQSAAEVRAALDAASSSGTFAAPQHVRRMPRRAMWAAVIALAAGVAAALAVGRLVRSGGAATGAIRSIAVLPLENLSGSPDEEYFADGMSELLMADLSKIGSLRVISRTSVMPYKKVRKPLTDIARELKVDAIVEGSVVRAGDRVRITAKLIGGATEETLWAESYERDVGDVLALQGEVASKIAREINVTVTPQEAAGLEGRRVDPAVHRLLLLGRFHLNRSTDDGLRKAIEYFDQVVARESDYADGHLGLASAFIGLADMSIEPPRDVIPKAKAAAEKAVTIDDSLAEAHAALGYIRLFYDWDGPAAEREFQRALRLNPSLASAHMYYAGYHLAVGRKGDAVPEIRRAVELDPLSLRTQAMATMFLLFAGRNDEAIAQARVALELEPKFGPAFAGQALALAEQRRFAEAVASIEEALKFDRSWRWVLFGAHVHAVAGDEGEARKLIAEAGRIDEKQYVCAYEVACAYVSLGDHDEAYRWFKKGIEDRADCMAWLGVEPWVEPFRKDRRYKELLAEIGLAK